MPEVHGLVQGERHTGRHVISHLAGVGTDEAAGAATVRAEARDVLQPEVAPARTGRSAADGAKRVGDHLLILK